MKLLNLLGESINKKILLKKLEDMGYDEENAEDELDNLLYFIKNLPEKVKLYRIIKADDISDINDEEIGSHFSDSKKDLLGSHTFSTGYGEKTFLVTVKAPKTLIDTQSTLENRIYYPNEREITLKNKGKGVEIINIQEI